MAKEETSFSKRLIDDITYYLYLDLSSYDTDSQKLRRIEMGIVLLLRALLEL